MLARSCAVLLAFGAAGIPTRAIGIDGTWELATIFRTGPQAQRHAVAIDSTTYLRLTLESHPGGWLSGSVYRRYHGQGERSKLVGGVLGATGRYALSADFDAPEKEEAHTALWPEGEQLMIGTSFVPDADSAALRRVSPNAPYPPTVLEVVSAP